MKKVIIVCLTLVTGMTAGQSSEAPESKDEVKTLFGDAKLIGGYVGMSMRGFELNDQYGYGVGGEVAAVFGRKFNLGFSGYVLGTDIPSPYVDQSGDQYYYDLAYGGLYIEPVLGSRWPVHLSFPITLGAGGVSQSKYRIYDEYWRTSYDADWFGVAEGGVNVELNIFKFMRLAGGVNYRLTSDVYLLGGSKQQLSGFGGNVTIKLGWF